MNPGRNEKFWMDGEFYLLAALSLLGLVFFVMTWSYSPTAALFPRIVSLVVGGLSLYTLAGRLRVTCKVKAIPGRIEEEKPAQKTSPVSGVAWYVSLSFMAAYFFLIYAVGFVPATLAYLLAVPLVMGYRRKLIIAVVAVLFAAMVYFSFSSLLHVPLPEGWLGRFWS